MTATVFQRPLTGFRWVDTLFGDSLQSIAARELGDAARWVDIVAYNRLRPPFITDDAADAGDGVVLTGQRIMVPAPTPVVTSTTDPEQVFERDVMLERGTLTVTEGGDFDLVSGRANLVQALKHRLVTDRGELLWHTEYGSNIRRLLGTVNGPTAALLAAQYARSAVGGDPRVSRVSSAKAEVNGNVVRVTVEAEAVAGRSVGVTTNL